jgi:5,5'-dehydrodivanillate O-demethylase
MKRPATSHKAPHAKEAKQAARVSYADILRVGPGTIAGRYLRRFWHPVFVGADLAPGQIKPIRILGEDLTLYRGESGTAHIVGGRCAHRGVQLVLGFIHGEHIECPYHGWTYDASGQCVAQPGEQRPFCDRVKIKGYPVEEYLGLVFVYLREGKAPPLPRLADFENDDLYIRRITTEVWPCSYFDLLENATDLVHTEYLHWHFGYKTSGNLDWRESDWGMIGRFDRSIGTGDEAIYNRSYFHMPTAAEFAQIGRPGFPGIFTRAWRVPRDDDSAIRFNLDALPRHDAERFAARVKAGTAGTRDESSTVRPRSVTETAADLIAGRENMRDLKARSETMSHFYLTNIQDCAVLASLGPPAERTFDELLGRTDVSVALMRRLWLRELKAFAEGKPLTQWRRPEYLWADITDLHREGAKKAAVTS